MDPCRSAEVVVTTLDNLSTKLSSEVLEVIGLSIGEGLEQELVAFECPDEPRCF